MIKKCNLYINNDLLFLCDIEPNLVQYKNTYNLGLNKIISIGEDILTVLNNIGLIKKTLLESDYNIINFAILVELLMDRPETYIENYPLKYCNDTNYGIIILDERKILNNDPLKRFARIIVLYVKNKENEIKKIGPENLSQLLTEPFRTALFKFQEIIKPGGYYNKYINYKNKYLKLKKLNYSSNNINAIAE
jgi:hypothetical protein